jgi:hypothetical protein
MGKWGGALFFIREGAPPQRLTRGNVHALVPTSAGVHALFGLAHMGIDEGHYRLISASNDGPSIGAEQPLPGSPIDIARDGGRTLVAGGFDDGGDRTWARVFGEGEPSFATVSPACA